MTTISNTPSPSDKMFQDQKNLFSQADNTVQKLAESSLRNNTTAISTDPNSHSITGTHSASVDTLQKSSAVFSSTMAPTAAVSTSETSRKTFSQVILEEKGPRFESSFLNEPNYSFTLTMNNKKITVHGAGTNEDGSLIATGAFGRVFFGKDPDTGKSLAIKVVVPQREGDRPLLEKEANFLLEMSESEYVLGAHKVGFNGDMMFVVMDKIDGNELFDKLADGANPLSLRDKVSILLDMVKGIQELHVKGIIHRDLKPENILVDKQGKAKLIDLGTAANVGEQIRDVEGTLRYMAPETLSATESSPQATHTDIYTGGLIIHEVLSGELFTSKKPGAWQRQRIKNDIKVTESTYTEKGFTEDQASQICAIVNPCLQLDPNKRPDAKDLMQKLEQLQKIV